MELTGLAEITSRIAVVMIPFLMVAGLWGLSEYVRRRESARIDRQIALTDAVHRKLGAAAAPEVRRDWGGWTVSMVVPFEQEGIVSAVVRVVHDFFATSHPRDVPRLRILLRPRKPTPWRRIRRSSAARLATHDLTRVA